MTNRDEKKSAGYVESVKILDVEKRYRSGPKHYVYVIQVKWVNPLNVFIIYRRYAQFFDLQCKLLDLFGNTPSPSNQSKQTRQIPFLPGKIILGRSQIRQIALERKEALNDYCQVLISLPEHISRSQAVLDFFTPHESDVRKPAESISFEKKLLSTKLLSISKPIELPSYRCINDFKASDKLEMSVQKNVLVKVLQKHNNGWWFVQNGDQRGFVPGAFLQPYKETLHADEAETTKSSLSSSSSMDEVYVVNQKYEAAKSDELTLEQGSFVTVLEKPLTGWWKVKFNDKSGLFPAIYLSSCHGRHTPQLERSSSTNSRGFERSTDSSAQHSNDSDWDSDGECSVAELKIQTKPEIWYAHSRFKDDQGDCLSFERGDQIEIHRKYSNGWWSGRALDDDHPILTWIPANYLQQEPINDQTEPAHYETLDESPLYATLDSAGLESSHQKTKALHEENYANFDGEPLGPAVTHTLESEKPAELSKTTIFPSSIVETPPLHVEEKVVPAPPPPPPTFKAAPNKPTVGKPSVRNIETNETTPKSVKDLVKIFNQRKNE